MNRRELPRGHPHGVIAGPDDTSSAREIDPIDLGVSPRQRGAQDSPRADRSRDHFPRPHRGDRLLRSVGHQDRRIACQAPGRFELGTPQSVGFVRREGRRPGPVGPGQPALGRLVAGHEPRRADRQEAALAVDHRVADVGRGGAHQGDPAGRARLDPTADPLRGRPRLARAAAHEHQPGPPVAVRWPLIAPRPRVLPALAGRPAAGTPPAVPVPRARVGPEELAMPLQPLNSRPQLPPVRHRASPPGRPSA